ncbi:MAG: hypothetical protein ACOYIE_03725 [Agathobaculum sp.]|jgi:hypothetical protein|uniref:hypothetical protein n=1 Tax=Agathobaculum sp. TaxID=2048138 RepID=UPI003D913270
MFPNSDSLSHALEHLLETLTPAEIVPDAAPSAPILCDSFADWKRLLAEQLHTAQTFEIHCWAEETDAIQLALQYGTRKDTGWQYGTVIAGPVTPAFTQMLLHLPQPSDTHPDAKKTPFFSIFLDNGFSASHYGTEIYQKI